MSNRGLESALSNIRKSAFTIRDLCLADLKMHMQILVCLLLPESNEVSQGLFLFQASTQLRLQNFGIRLKNEARSGTLIFQSLVKWIRAWPLPHSQPHENLQTQEKNAKLSTAIKGHFSWAQNDLA